MNGRVADELRLIVLGSGSGLPTARRDTTGYLVRRGRDVTLVDCPGGVVHKLLRHGVTIDDISRVVLTHDHVDHIYGLPHLLHAMAIQGGRSTLPLFAPEQALARAAAILQAHDLHRPEYPRLLGRAIPLRVGVVVDESEVVRVTAAPARHGRDTVSLRFECADGSLAVSSDTLPNHDLVHLAAGVQLLLHDCGGLHEERLAGFGAHHASAREAAEVATAAAARALLLVHLPTDRPEALAALQEEAAAAFAGSIFVAEDDGEYLPGRLAAASAGALR